MVTQRNAYRIAQSLSVMCVLIASIFGFAACSFLNSSKGEEGVTANVVVPSSSGSWFGSMAHFLSRKKGPHDSAVTAVDFTLGPGNEGRLIPGQPLSFNIVVIDRDGKKYSWVNGELEDELIKVTTQLADFDMPTRTVKPLAEIEKIRNASYEIVVQYGDRSDLAVKKTFLPDVAVLLGPDPQDVVSVQAQVKTQYTDLLIPGRPVGVLITVTDKGGRVYTLGEAIPRLVPERIKVSTKFMKWDGMASTVLPQEDLSTSSGARYELVVEYVDRADIRATKTFVPDFAMLKGPAPHDVKSLTVSMNGKDDGKPITPGSSLPLVVQVQDQLGRVFSFPKSADGFNLPKERVQMAMENMTLEPHSFALKTNTSYKEMIGKNFVLSVAYEGRPDLKVTKSLKPDFAGALRDLFPKTPILTFQGEAGKSGQEGHSGKAGIDGRGSSGKYGTGGGGTRGEDGHPGRAGGEGRQGLTVRVAATEVFALDGETRMILFNVKIGQEKKATYYVWPWESPAIRIVAAGGKGGDGGNGGNGGDGGKGGFGYNSGSGGDGGSGGTGANGGTGGQGGKLFLSATSKELLDHFILETPGGRGGHGGEAGGAGRGGASGGATGAFIGAAGDLAAGLVGALSGGQSSYTPNVAPPPQLGNDGDSGQEGYPGEQGRDGIAGTPLVKVDMEETMQALIKDVPQEITDRIVVSRK